MLNNHPVARLVLIVGIAAGLLLLIPIRMPFSISSHGKIFYGKEWVVSRDNAGRISASLYDRVNGRTDVYSVHQFERQDAVRFELHPSIRPGAAVSAGDTLARIHSSQLAREIISLKGEMSVALASLDLYQTGEKEAIVGEARNRLAYAEQQIEGYRVMLDRQRELHERKLISDQELDIAEQQARLYEIDRLIAEAQLQSALTGAKNEHITYINTRIAALGDEIRSLQQTIDDYTYLSPIDGIVYHTFSRDTLAHIGEPSRYVAVIPVPLRYREYVSEGQQVTIEVPGNNVAAHTATVQSVGNMVRIIDGNQYFMVNAVMELDHGGYLPGLFISARLHSDSVTLREYLKRYLRPII
jgi:multidrug efflux pump subunit AcrA (membrane-fusion protein)